MPTLPIFKILTERDRISFYIKTQLHYLLYRFYSHKLFCRQLKMSLYQIILFNLYVWKSDRMKYIYCSYAYNFSAYRISHTVGDVPTGVVRHAISYRNLVALNDALNSHFSVKGEILYLNILMLFSQGSAIDIISSKTPRTPFIQKFFSSKCVKIDSTK